MYSSKLASGACVWGVWLVWAGLGQAAEWALLEGPKLAPVSVAREGPGEVAVMPDDVVPTPSATPADRPPAPLAPVPDSSAAEPEQPFQTACCDEPFRLFRLPRLRYRGIDVRGWIDQGFTWNPDDPAYRFNGPVTFNDRSNEYQLNQAYLIAERVTQTGGAGWDLGGRIDLMYGTDSRFLVAYGLEDDWNQSQRFYGAAMPQLYADVAVNRWVIRMGRFYSPVGFESPMAANNFFYSHTYLRQYGEPFTHTGLLARFNLNDCLALAAGFHRGWDMWEDNNDKIGFLGGASWISPSERTTLAVNVVASNELIGVESARTLVSLVLTQRLGERWKYVSQADIAYESNAVWDRQQGLVGAEWYGFAHYLFCELNPCWTVGLRHEWFSDDDGVRVSGLGYPKGIVLGAVPSHWNELAFGVNYKPNANVILRSELRWDWVDPLVFVYDRPFDDYSDGSQFLWGTDLIVKF